jgi:pilus assembly protein CpaE
LKGAAPASRDQLWLEDPAIKFLVYYHSPEQGDYLQQVVSSSDAGMVLAAGHLQELPARGENRAQVILLEYQEGNPELDRWIEQTAADPGSPAIFLYFPQISATSLLKVLRLGPRECFTYPIKEEEFQQAVTRVLSRAAGKPEPTMVPRIVSFLGCKGGAGTTFLAANAAALLAQERQGQVLLLDLDLQYGQLVHFFDARPSQTLSDAVRHFAELDVNYLKSILYSHNKQLQILPAPARLEEGEGVTPEHVEQILANAKKLPGFGWILIDAGHQFGEVTLKAVELSDELVLVAAPSIAALSNAKKLLELLHLLGLERLTTRLWLNAWQKDEDLSLEEVATFLGRQVSGTVRYDHRQVARSINEGRPLAETAPRHAVCQDLKTMVAMLKGEEPAANNHGLGWSWLKRLGGRS